MALDKRAAIRFGMLIAAQRKRRGWSVLELADKAGMNQGQLYRVEGGQRGLYLDTAVRLATVTGVSLDLLLSPCPKCGDSPPAGFTCNTCCATGDDGDET